MQNPDSAYYCVYSEAELEAIKRVGERVPQLKLAGLLMFAGMTVAGVVLSVLSKDLAGVEILGGLGGVIGAAVSASGKFDVSGLRRLRRRKEQSHKAIKTALRYHNI